MMNNATFQANRNCHTVSTMKTYYEVHVLKPGYCRWSTDLRSTNLNSKPFQKRINGLVALGAKFKVVEVTEKVICTNKTHKKW